MHENMPRASELSAALEISPCKPFWDGIAYIRSSEPEKLASSYGAVKLLTTILRGGRRDS